MTAYDPAAWHDLFVAIAGAASALTGLLFVAVSINLSDILKTPGLPLRAVETLSVLTGLLLLSVFGLVPAQSRAVLGVETVVLGAGIAVPLVWARLRTPRGANDPLVWLVAPLSVLIGATVPLMIGGISLVARHGGGLYWLVAEIVLGFVGAVVNAWILLVEIHR